MSEPTAPEIYDFPPFRLDTVKRRLLRDGASVPLTPKAFELLCVLVENRQRVMTKDELLAQVWPDAIVEEGNLSQNVSLARKALGEQAGRHQYIVTVPGRGYRFVADVVARAPLAATALEVVITPEIVPEAETIAKPEVEAAPPVTSETRAHFDAAESLEPRSEQVEKPRPFWSFRRAFYLLPFAFLLVPLALLAWSSRSKDAGAARPFKSLAVLPLKNLSGQTAPDSSDYFSDGLTDSLITAFAKIDGLTVISRGSVFRFKGQDTDPREAGRLLGVEAILEGSVRQTNDAVRVTVRLVNAQDGRVLWTGESFERAMNETAGLQDEIARNLADSLRLELSAAAPVRWQPHRTDNPQAYAAYLKGRHFWNKRTAENFYKAIGFFKQALDAEPNYAPAYAGLADCYQLLPEYAGTAPSESFPQAKAAAQKALALDDTLAEAHAALGYTLMVYEWDWTGAEREFQRALALNPNYATAHQWYGEYLTVMRRYPEALQEFERARQLDPLAAIVKAEFPAYYYGVRQFDRAIAEAQKMALEEPDFPYSYGMVWLAYAQSGQEPEAVASFTKFIELLGDKAGADELRRTYAAEGYVALWRKWLALMEMPPRSGFVTAWARVLAYVRLKDREKTLEWLEKSYQRRDRFIINIGNDPQFDELRDTPRFQELLHRLRLPTAQAEV